MYSGDEDYGDDVTSGLVFEPYHTGHPDSGYLCPTCGSLIYIDHEQDDDTIVQEWGKYSAECVECGGEYRFLERQWNGHWKDSMGDILRPA